MIGVPVRNPDDAYASGKWIFWGDTAKIHRVRVEGMDIKMTDRENKLGLDRS